MKIYFNIANAKVSHKFGVMILRSKHFQKYMIGLLRFLLTAAKV